MWLILTAIIAFALFILFYKWVVKNNDFFKDKGVAFMKPVRNFFHKISQLIKVLYCRPFYWATQEIYYGRKNRYQSRF